MNMRTSIHPILLLPVVAAILFAPNLLNGQCNPDTESPTIVCDDQIVINVSPDGFVLDLNMALETAFDNCDMDLDLEFMWDGISVSAPIGLGCDDTGLHIATLTAIDDAGNENSCFTEVTINGFPPALACNADNTVDIHPDSTNLFTEDLILEGVYEACPDDYYFTFSVNGGDFVEDLYLDCSMIGPQIIAVAINTFNEEQLHICWGNVEVTDPEGYCTAVTVSGQVFYDDQSNCALDAGENFLEGVEVKVANQQGVNDLTVITDANGFYSATSYFDLNAPDAEYEVSLPSAPSQILPCGSTIAVPIPAGMSSVSADFPVFAEDDCPLLDVDIAAPVFRFCMESTLTVSYFNYNALAAPDSYIEVTLDPLLSVQNTSLPISSADGDVYTFDLGDLPPLQGGSFTIDVLVDCDLQQGLTLCVEAHIFPDEVCDDPSGSWSGASITAEGSCEGDSVRFLLKNIGTGDMIQPLDYMIVEDVVMYLQGNYQLNAGQELEVAVPANGATWRIEADQSPGHPGVSQPAAWAEGCGGLNNPGQVNLFAVDNNDPFISVFCLEVTFAYDPNDKQGFPLGYGDENYIKPNQDIDYMIRFQNTGTDTAFNVVLVDTLDEHFNLATLRPGAGSHHYEFESDGNGVIRFVFNDIMLPDSNVNVEGSQGFVKFRISQQADLAPGTKLHNQAAIYFDFNPPIFTNETTHTIELLSTATSSIPQPQNTVIVSPNPFTDQVVFQIPGWPGGEGAIRLFNTRGQLLRIEPVYSDRTPFYRKNLPSGIYFYDISTESGVYGQGKLVIK
jgi:uncharacterized repeat protein (TIGR01451 family)